MAGRKLEKLQASSPLQPRSWGPRRRRSAQVGLRSRRHQHGSRTGQELRDQSAGGRGEGRWGVMGECQGESASSTRSHHPRSPNPGPGACSRCWPGAQPSRRRACGSGPAWCRTARRPGAASPASLCSVGRRARLPVQWPSLERHPPGPELPPYPAQPHIPSLCLPPSSPCRVRSTH